MAIPSASSAPPPELIPLLRGRLHAYACWGAADAGTHCSRRRSVARRPNAWARVFGFHGLVVAAAIAHFVTLARWIVPAA